MGEKTCESRQLGVSDDAAVCLACSSHINAVKPIDGNAVNVGDIKAANFRVVSPGPRQLWKKLLLVSIYGSIALMPGPVVAEQWLHTSPPPEMEGDKGDWWLDSESISTKGEYTFFTLLRRPGSPPLSDDGSGYTAINCSTGDRLVRGVCTGACSAADFPDGWLEQPRLTERSPIYKAVCGLRHR